MKKKATAAPKSPPAPVVAQFVGSLYAQAAPRALRSKELMQHPQLAKLDHRAVGRAISLLRRRGEIEQVAPQTYRAVTAVPAEPAPIMRFTRENARNAHAIATQQAAAAATTRKPSRQSLMARIEGMEKALHKLFDDVYGDDK